MKVYKILRTDKAEDQLRDIIYYIADESGSIPRYSILKKQRYRVLILEKHLVFYKVNEEDKTVIIYSIVDGKREYKDLI